MELGFARFLEMFEERFGRFVTTLLMGALAIAAAAWAIQTTVEAAVYLYTLAKDADFTGALKTEYAATHLIIFGAQIVATYIVLSLFWRLFWRRKINAIEADYKASEARIMGRLQESEEHSDKFEALYKEREQRLDNKSRDIVARMEVLRAKLDAINAERNKTGS